MSDEVPGGAIGGVDEATPEGTEAPAPRRLGRVGLWARVALAGLVGFAVAAVAFLSQTASGQRLVLDELLSRARGALAGELVIGGIRSQTLVAGFTLDDVRLDAEGGARVAEADSIVIRYSIVSLLTGRPTIRSATLHGLSLVISRAPGENALNVQRLLPPRSATDSVPAGPPATLDLGRIAVRSGTIEVLTPAAEAGRTTVEAPDGSPLRRLLFENVDLDLEETLLRPGGAVVLDARLASFNSTIHVVAKPLVVQAAVGNLTFGVEGIRIQQGAFRLPSSMLEGDLGFGPTRPRDPWTFAAHLRSEEWGDLDDLRWIDERIPAGTFRGAADVSVEDGVVLDFRGLEVETGASVLAATGGVRFADEMSLSRLVVTATPIATSDLEPWIGGKIPIIGFVSGQATLSGVPTELQVDGRLTLVPTGIPGPPMTADLTGTLFLGDDPGAAGLIVRFDPLNYRLLQPYWADASNLDRGAGLVRLEGRADEGMLVVADLSHVSESGPPTRVYGEGVFRREASGGWMMDVRTDLTPLALELVGRFRPDLALRGAVSGSVTVQGPTHDLHFRGSLIAGEGTVSLEGSVNASDLGAAYALDLDAQALNLTAYTSRVPDPSVMSGRVELTGSGFALDSLQGAASVQIRSSLVGPIRIASADTELQAAAGLLSIGRASVEMAGARISGSGTLGMTSKREGESNFTFAVDSLGAFRPFFIGDSILVRDGLSPLEEDLLRVRGIDPDTLPSEIDVRMTGSASGTAAVRGHFADLDVDLVFDASGLAYRHNALDSAHVALSVTGLPDITGDWDADIRAHGVQWESRTFGEVDFTGVMSQGRGDGTLNVLRRAGERYLAEGSFAIDSVGGEVALARASAEVDDLLWVLNKPGTISWDATSLALDGVELVRAGPDSSRVVAQGTLTRGGESDFRVEMEGFHAEYATQILQLPNLDVSGHVDLTLSVLGPAENPTLNALFQIEEPRYGVLHLGRLDGSVVYRDRNSTFRIDAWEEDRNVLSATGTLPLDLGLVDVEERTLDEPMDVNITARSLDASIALAYFATLEDVQGTISADLQIGGTSREPQPSGTIRLADGAWTISALGVRHTGLSGKLDLHPDRTVDVNFGTTQAGASAVTGVVTMAPLSNPTLDLEVTLDQFRAVSRRDIESVLSGAFTIRGEYRLPVAEGSLRVDEGTLFVDEFARSASVVDLRDPSLFAEGFAVDTTVFVTQPILAGLRNPFLDNLRVDIDLSVPRNLWLRSNRMDVEIGGDLLVRYDRAENDLVMVGDLEALRGSYQVLGRTFEVDGGTVSFVGQPGVNPTLGIEALSRVRRRGGDRLEVRANVTGTLVQPLVTLSTAEAGLSQSDLVTYLLFGVASGELGVSATNAGGGRIGQDAGAGALTFAGGVVGSQLGSALAQGIGLDYFAISQGDVVTGNVRLEETLASPFATAQVELGQYFGDDLFVVAVLGQPDSQSGSSTGLGWKQLRGVRVELALTEDLFLEGFAEDRFLRSSGALMQTGLENATIVGLLVFRDWGYGSN